MKTANLVNRVRLKWMQPAMVLVNCTHADIADARPDIFEREPTITEALTTMQMSTFCLISTAPPAKPSA